MEDEYIQPAIETCGGKIWLSYEQKPNAWLPPSLTFARTELEGILRQAEINKGRNRDTAVFSIIDKEWPVRKVAFEKWLHADNFDSEGRQKKDLVSIRKQLEIDRPL